MLPEPRKLIAAAIGVLLAGLPMLALDYWVEGLIRKQSASEVDTFARRSVNLAEARLDATLTALNGLAKAGINGCQPEQVEALRQANLSLGWVKQMAVLGPADQPLCSDLALPLSPAKVIASRAVSGSQAVIEVVRIGDHGKPMVRLRRPILPGPDSLSALFSSEALVAPLVVTGRNTGYGQLALLDGTVIEEAGRRPPDSESLWALDRNSRVSDRFGLRVTTLSPQVDVATLAGLRDIATGMTALFALVLFGFALVLSRRESGSPADELRRALNAGEFIPYYQPTVDITSGKLRGAEVLMRWKKRDGTIVAPANFIPLAESSGLILAMTRSLMRQVVADLGPVCAARPKMSIGFNITARHFADDKILRDLRSIFDLSQLRYSQVVLEVTERQPLENLNRTRRVIAAMQDMGVRVAIDDVGTGHGGLSYILKLGADIIKIDKMFVDALGHDNRSSTIVETLVDLAHSMRMEIVAEGVETFEQVIALRERGVRLAQGYVFAPPLPASSFLSLVEAIDPRKESSETDEQADCEPDFAKPRAAAAA